MTNLPWNALLEDEPKQNVNSSQPQANANQAQPQVNTNQPQSQAKTKKKPERKATRYLNEQDLKYIYDNYKDKSVSEIAKELGLTEFQVRRGRQLLVKTLLEKAGDDPAKQEKVKQLIKEKLTKTPQRKGESETKEKVNNLVDKLLANI